MIVVKNTFYFHLPKVQQPRDKKPQQEEPPVDNLAIDPGQEREERVSMVQGEEGMKEHFVFQLLCVILVTGINKGFPENWLETYMVRKGIVCNCSFTV